MRLALGQGGAGHDAGALQANQAGGIIEQVGRRADGFERRGPQLLGMAGAVAEQHVGARLEHGLEFTRRPASDVGGMNAVHLRQDMGNGAGFAVRPCVQNIGFVFKFHLLEPRMDANKRE